MSNLKAIREDFARMRAKNLLKDYRIKKPPTNVDLLASKLKIEVIYHDLNNIEFSFSIKDKDKYYVILVISGSYGRDRWTLAHEIGHIILNHYELYRVDTIYEDRLSEEERYILDREADIFAEELLMPSEWVARNKSLGIDNLKDVFEVSKEAISVRLKKICTV